MRRLAVLVGAALALAVAGADGQENRTVAATDTSKDVRGPLDLRRVALTKVSARRARGELTLRRRWGTADLRGVNRASGSLCLRLWRDRDDVDGAPPRWLVCATPAARGDRLVGRVLRDRPNRLPETIAEATVSRPTERTLYLRFPRSVFKKAFGVYVGSESVSRAKGCPKPIGCRDLAPNAPGAVYLQLR